MRKTKELIVVIAVLAALIALVGLVQAKDLRDYLWQPPGSVYAEYGWDEDTFRFYNMVANKELGQGHEPRIKALENKVAKLLIEVNELKNRVSEAAVLPTMDEREAVDTKVPSEFTVGEGGIGSIASGEPGRNTLPNARRTENKYPVYESRFPKPTDANEVAK